MSQPVSPLARQQQALLAALFQSRSENAIKTLADHAYLIGIEGQKYQIKPAGDAFCAARDRGLVAYQSNGHELANRALLASYPVLRHMLGPENFEALARAFWHAGPPEKGDLAQWGADLASFIAGSDQLAGEPYLPAVAQVEWALHEAAGAADEVADLASFALLTSAESNVVKLWISGAAKLFESPWPVVTLIVAHENLSSAESRTSPDLAIAAHMLHNRVAQTAVVWREGLRPRLREALPGEASFLHAAKNGEPLEAALNAAPELDFGAWLPMAVQTGLLLGVGV
jgi:hypothetical protein